MTPRNVSIKKLELRNLLFWATHGFIQSNGGTGERTIHKIIAKYAKEAEFTSGHWPPLTKLNTKRIGACCFDTYECDQKVKKELKKIFPKVKILNS